MPQPLYVTRIMPAKMLAPPLLDHVGHGIDPLWMAQGSEAIILRFFDRTKHVPAFKCVAARAHTAFHFN